MKTMKEKGNMNMYEACKVKEAMYSKLAVMMKELEQEINTQVEYQAEKKEHIERQMAEDENYKESYNHTWDEEYINESIFKEKACRMILTILEEGAENA